MPNLIGIFRTKKPNSPFLLDQVLTLLKRCSYFRNKLVLLSLINQYPCKLQSKYFLNLRDFFVLLVCIPSVSTDFQVSMSMHNYEEQTCKKETPKISVRRKTIRFLLQTTTACSFCSTYVNVFKGKIWKTIFFVWNCFD